MLRTFVLVSLLGSGAAGCVPHSAEPAWPKLSEAEVDGGESLEPHKAVAINEAASDDDTDTASTDSTDTSVTADDTSAVDTDSAAASSDDDTAAPSDDDAIELDDIVIEIEDD